MKNNWIQHLKWYVPGLLLGAFGGYIYWYNWGCEGTCLITSSPVRSMIYFGIMGVVANNMFKPTERKERTAQDRMSKSKA